MDEHFEVHATVTDRWGGTETVYAGSVPAWSWPHSTEWKRVRRTLILSDRTSDPRGWRVTFNATPEQVTP
jgi:hypothetical protein